MQVTPNRPEETLGALEPAKFRGGEQSLADQFRGLDTPSTYWPIQ